VDDREFLRQNGENFACRTGLKARRAGSLDIRLLREQFLDLPAQWLNLLSG
jgi:hypothetical protein